MKNLEYCPSDITLEVTGAPSGQILNSVKSKWILTIHKMVSHRRVEEAMKTETHMQQQQQMKCILKKGIYGSKNRTSKEETLYQKSYVTWSMKNRWEYQFMLLLVRLVLKSQGKRNSFLSAVLYKNNLTTKTIDIFGMSMRGCGS